jgi:glycosyltransferase involved in cell wall biosynthesis
MDNLRIAIVHSAFGERGGAERSVLEQAKYLSRKNGTTLFATYSRPAQSYPQLMKDLDILELVGLRIPKLELASNVALGLILAKKCARKLDEYDVVLSHQQPGPWIASCSRRPYVVQIQSLLTKLYPEHFPDPEAFPHERIIEKDYDRALINLVGRLGGSALLRSIDRLSMRGARKVLVQSRRLAEIAKDIYDVQPLRVRYGIDFADLTRADSKPVFSKYEIEPPLILMATRLIPSKGAGIAIQIMPRILREHPHSTLVIACPRGPYQSYYDLYAKRLKVKDRTRIITVSSSELKALYSGASVVCFPSCEPENAPRAVVEAMHYGIPVVAWGNGWGGAEIMAESGGMLARPYETDDFADKILALLNDQELRRMVVEHAKQYVATLSWDNVGPRFEQILQKAAC